MDSLAAAPPRRPALPPVGAFLRDSFTLGKRSIRPALPALVFLCFYYFGTGLFLEFAGQATTSLGRPDERAQLIHLMMSLAAYLPLLVLIQLPMLPLQDALRRDEPLGFLDAIRRVLERFPSLTGAGIIQALVVGVPALVLFLIGAAFVAGAGTVAPEAAVVAFLLVLIPIAGWCVLASAYFGFVGPIVILDDGGPIASIRQSVSLAWDHFWGLVGRFIAWSVVILLGYVVVTFPATMLQVGAAVSGAELPIVKISRVLWNSVATALILPFWVSALVTLYRELVPRAAAAPDPGPAAPPSGIDAAPGTEPTPPEDPASGASPQRFE